MAWRPGKMPTTSVRLRISLFSRSYGEKFRWLADGWGWWWLRPLAMITEGDAPRDLSRLVVPLRGSLEATGDLFEPYRLVDAHGVVVVPVAVYFRELAACGRPTATHRSYAHALPWWWRPVGGRRVLGSGEPGGGPGFLLVAPVR
jgi:hypothetical protein